LVAAGVVFVVLIFCLTVLVYKCLFPPQRRQPGTTPSLLTFGFYFLILQVLTVLKLYKKMMLRVK
jgi:hypothetical protein